MIYLAWNSFSSSVVFSPGPPSVAHGPAASPSSVQALKPSPSLPAPVPGSKPGNLRF